MSGIEWLCFIVFFLVVHPIIMIWCIGFSIAAASRRFEEKGMLFGDGPGLLDELADIRGRIIEIESKVSTRN